MERRCKCGEKLKPHKKWFKNVIIYKCPRSSIFDRNHTVNKEYTLKAKPLNIGIINK